MIYCDATNRKMQVVSVIFLYPNKCAILRRMEQQKKLGAPPKPPEERLKQRSIRLKPAQWAKVDEYGLAWLRALIDKAKAPK